MSIIYNNKRYLFRQRRRLEISFIMPVFTRIIFELLRMLLIHYKPDYMTVEVIQRFFAFKLALSIVLLINDYNYNINRVDIINQLRSDLTLYRIIKRFWLLYWF